MAKEKYILNGRQYDGNVIRKRVSQYNRTPEGQLKRKEWYLKNKERMNEWTRKHLNDKRIWARENNYCTTCFKNKQYQGYKSCKKCIDRQKQYKVTKINESKIE